MGNSSSTDDRLSFGRSQYGGFYGGPQYPPYPPNPYSNYGSTYDIVEREIQTRSQPGVIVFFMAALGILMVLIFTMKDSIPQWVRGLIISSIFLLLLLLTISNISLPREWRREKKEMRGFVSPVKERVWRGVQLRLFFQLALFIIPVIAVFIGIEDWANFIIAVGLIIATIGSLAGYIAVSAGGAAIVFVTFTVSIILREYTKKDKDESLPTSMTTNPP